MQVKVSSQVFVINKVWLVITLVAFLILIKLSHWQLSRAEQKTEQLSKLAQLEAAGPISWAQLRRLTETQADGVLFSGDARWLSPYLWLLDNQIVDGKVGYDVVIPVQFGDDNQQILLINLGWTAAPVSRDVLPLPQIPANLQLQGLVRTRLAGFRLGQNLENHGQWPMRLQQIEIEELSGLLPFSLYPGLLYQQHNSPFLPHYQPVVLLPEKHRGYALQWFLLAVAVLGVAIAASHKRQES